ncbi:minor capsid protein [Capybara microvirus Cap1_SP_200]|nr:minor capsid protein [Capybara microvirus Cap1_SP_200]
MAWYHDLALGAASSSIGGFINSAFGSNNAEQQLQYQKELAEYINSNKHQWEVKDLKAAGLNPILSATGGSAIGVGGVGSLVSGDNGLGSSNMASNSALKMNKATNEINEKLGMRGLDIQDKRVENQNKNDDELTLASALEKAASTSKLDQERQNSIIQTMALRDYYQGMVGAANANASASALGAAAAWKQAENTEYINSALHGKFKSEERLNDWRSNYQSLVNDLTKYENATAFSLKENYGYAKTAGKVIKGTFDMVRPGIKINTDSYRDDNGHWRSSSGW